MPDNGKYYYEIRENAARRAKEMNSFSEYRAGSATAEYRSMVDKAVGLAERQKKRVDPMYHEKIDYFLDKYCRKLAENLNKENEIRARVPSVMIAGPSNFPVRAKEKQNRAHDKNMEEWQYIQGLLDKIQGIGTAGISADDKNALSKLESKLEQQENEHQMMKDINAYFRKHGTCIGCPLISEDTARKLDIDVERGYSWEKQPFPAYSLQNSNQRIRHTKQRIAALKKQAEISDGAGWKFDGGEVVFNKDLNRVQIFHDEKPNDAVRQNLKQYGFRWSPSEKAWQRQLNSNGIYAAKRVTRYEKETPKIPKESVPQL